MKKELLVLAIASLVTTGVMAENSVDERGAVDTGNVATITRTEIAGETPKKATKTVRKVVKKKVQKTQEVTLAASDVFKVSLDQDLSTKTNTVGDRIAFTVSEDVMVGDVLVVRKGTSGEGRVKELKKARSFGRNASLDLNFDVIEAVDGTTFTAEQGSEAKAKTKDSLKAAGASVAGVALLGPVGLVGGFFVKGKDITIPAGTEVYVQPTGTVSIVGELPGQLDVIEEVITEEVPVTTESDATFTDDSKSGVKKNESSAVESKEENDEVKNDAVKTDDKADMSKNQVENSTEETEEDEDIPTSPIIVVKRAE